MAPNWSGLLTFFPLTAILHNAVFFPRQCILNPVVGADDYTVSAIIGWLAIDPSPYIAIVLAALLLLVPRAYVLAFVIAFIPLVLWVWDVPFSSRWVCRHLHDLKFPLRSWHFYAIGVALYLPCLWMLKRFSPSAVPEAVAPR